MKTLKFDHDEAEQIIAGQKNSTWRLYDDKDLSVNDDIKIIDKLDPKSSKTWRVIGQGKVSQIIEKKLGDVTSKDMVGHESFRSQEEMLQEYKSRYGERVSTDTAIKMVSFNFVPTAGDIPSEAMLLEEARIYTDGGSRGNPGESACAYAICDLEDSLVEKGGFYLGIATNNQAEYYGMKKALERARELGIDRVAIFSDSQLVVNQMKGLYKVKNQELAPLHQDVQALGDSFEEVFFTYVPREANKIADSEVNRILDEQARNKRFKRR